MLKINVWVKKLFAIPLDSKVTLDILFTKPWRDEGLMFILSRNKLDRTERRVCVVYLILCYQTLLFMINFYYIIGYWLITKYWEDSWSLGNAVFIGVISVYAWFTFVFLSQCFTSCVHSTFSLLSSKDAHFVVIMHDRYYLGLYTTESLRWNISLEDIIENKVEILRENFEPGGRKSNKSYAFLMARIFKLYLGAQFNVDKLHVNYFLCGVLGVYKIGTTALGQWSVKYNLTQIFILNVVLLLTNTILF